MSSVASEPAPSKSRTRRGATRPYWKRASKRPSVAICRERRRAGRDRPSRRMIVALTIVALAVVVGVIHTIGDTFRLLKKEDR